MIASDRPVVYRRHTNGLTWTSSGCYITRKAAVQPSVGAGESGDKKTARKR